MNKPDQQNRQNRLKTHDQESHNPCVRQANDRLRALVKFLARHAAEKDYKADMKCTHNQTNEGGN